jgi:hypothetical protein
MAGFTLLDGIRFKFIVTKRAGTHMTLSVHVLQRPCIIKRMRIRVAISIYGISMALVAIITTFYCRCGVATWSRGRIIRIIIGNYRRVMAHSTHTVQGMLCGMMITVVIGIVAA